ncbi:MAG: hypothetical protein R3359_08160, partial [Marinirhabdus sp.]|nr:hypothetical protein [Marinirhabdus sp.]
MLHLQRFAVILIALALIQSANAQQLQTVYSEISVKLPSFDAIQSLAEQGFDIDHYQGNWKEGMRFMVTQDELQRMQHLGHDVTVTIPNYKSYYTQMQAQ